MAGAKGLLFTWWAGRGSAWSQASPTPGISSNCSILLLWRSTCIEPPPQNGLGMLRMQENCRGKLVCPCRMKAWWFTNTWVAPKAVPECRRISQVIHKVIPDRVRSQHDHSQKCSQYKRDFYLWILSEVSFLACGSFLWFSILPVDPF